MKEEQKSRDVSKTEKSKRSSVAWNFFWIGFLVYTIAYSYPGITLSLKYLQPFQILGILLFVPSGIYLIKWSFESNYLKIVFLFYLLWSVVIIFRGFTLEYEFLKSMLFTAPFSIFIYFAPLILIFRDTEANLKKLVYVIIVLSFAFVVYVILFNKIIISGKGNT